MRHAFRPRNRNIEPNETGISTRLRHCCLLGIYLRANFNIPVGARKCELARVYKSLFEIFRTYTAHSSSTPANLITFFPPVRSAAFRHVCVGQVSVIWSNGKKKSSDGDEEMDLLNRVWFVLIEKLSITSDWWQFILQKHLRWF